jgi:hypothetical protein
MKKLFLVALATVFGLSGCTVYTEKQSEAVSENVYATNDSISKARVDLAQFYSNETTKFIKPPKNPVEIEPVYEKAVNDKNGNNKSEKQRVIVVPEQYKNDKVVVVNSEEYDNLLKDSQIKKQLEQDNIRKDLQLGKDSKELQKQKEAADKMVKDLNLLQKKLVQKDLAILWRDIVIVVLLTLIGIFFYLKISRPGLI